MVPQIPKDEFAQAREHMVDQQIAGRGVRDAAVLAAMRRVPRHAFVPPAQRNLAYADSALPIGLGQTISQPFIVGLMCELLHARPGQKILEIGTGSGYQTAVLAEMGLRVYSLDNVDYHIQRAQRTLADLGYAERCEIRTGDGYAGWPQAGPFHGILVSCAVNAVPAPLILQLAPNGRIVLPIGQQLGQQALTVVSAAPDRTLTYQEITGVVFVPMTGPHGFQAGW